MAARNRPLDWFIGNGGPSRILLLVAPSVRYFGFVLLTRSVCIASYDCFFVIL